jgi:hypothetical protein
MEQSTKSDGTCEARTAARWWAEQLGPDSKAQIGAADSEAFAWAAKSQQEKPTAEQIETFRAHLEQAIVPYLHQNAWEKAVTEDPQWGSALRAIDVDYGPHELLADALEAAGIPARKGTLLLPLKTVMWVNPGEVKVAAGHGAGIESLPLIEE